MYIIALGKELDRTDTVDIIFNSSTRKVQPTKLTVIVRMTKTVLACQRGLKKKPQSTVTNL